jgi:hypothetical protein
MEARRILQDRAIFCRKLRDIRIAQALGSDGKEDAKIKVLHAPLVIALV